MKILLTSLEYAPQVGGVAKYYTILKESWSKEDEFRVLDNQKKEILAERGPLPWLRAFGAIRREYRGFRADWLLVGQVLPLGTVAYLLSFFLKFKIGIFLHGMDLSLALSKKRKAFILKLILRRADLIISANTRVQEILLENFPKLESKIILLNPVARLSKAPKELKESLSARYLKAGVPLIFSVSRLVKRKGYDKVLEALALIKNQPFHYLIAGTGPELENLKKLQKDLGLEDKLEFLGFISEEEKSAYLELSQFFIGISREIGEDFEGFGIVYLEANLASKPVLAGRGGGVTDAVSNNLNGFLVDPLDERGIAEAILKFLKNPDLTKEMGRAGKERAEKDFSASAQAARLRGFLKV